MRSVQQDQPNPFFSCGAKEMNESNCSYLTDGQDKAIFGTKLAVLCLSFLANVASITILVYFKSFRRFVFRLILCLLVASLVGVVVQMLEIIPLSHWDRPIRVIEGWEPACAAFGFLDQVAIWMSNFVIMWIVGYLCWLMVQPRHKINFFFSDVSVLEAVGICFCFFLPFTFNWIPFTTDYYGEAGHWCWIKLSKTGDCWKVDGAWYIFTFYYGPLMLIMLVTSVISVIAVVVWCKNIVKSDPMKDLIFIVVYPIIFNLVCCIVTANRIEEVRRADQKLGPSFGLWFAHAVADPTRTLLPALFCLLQFFIPTTRKLVVQSKDETKDSKTQASAAYSKTKGLYTSL